MNLIKYKLGLTEMMNMNNQEEIVTLLQSNGFNTERLIVTIQDPISHTVTFLQMDKMQSLLYKQDLERLQLQEATIVQ